MKRIIILAVLACLPSLIFAEGGSEGWSIGLPITGNGNLITSEKPVSSFDKIRVAGIAEVNYHASPDYRAVVTVDSNLDEYVAVYTENNVLNIGTKNGRYYRFTKYMVDVYAPSISGLVMSGSVRFEGMNTITSPGFDLEISGAGKLKGDFECDQFNARISGSGEMDSHVVSSGFKAVVAGSCAINLAGSSSDLDISISGAGNFMGSEFKTNNVIASISGAGEMHIWALDTLKANIAGAGKVKYRGNPKIDYHASGAGRLESE